MNPVLSNGPEYPFEELERQKAERRRAGLNVYDFTVGDPLEPTPAFIREALVRSIEPRSQYPSASGTPELQRTIAEYLERRFAVSVDASQDVIVTAGAKEAVFHLPLALVDPLANRRVVVWGQPGYPIYERGAAYARAEGRPFELSARTGYLLEPDEVGAEVLERTAIFWLNTPHNPTGATANRAYLERVAEASDRFGFVVASDETYVDLYWDAPPPSMLEIKRDNVLVMHSLSKRSGMTGYRSGFIAGDARLIGPLKRMRPAIGTSSPVFIQEAARAAWADDDHVADRRIIFREKHRRLSALCAELGLETQASDGGLYVWFRAPGDDARGYAARLLRAGVAVTPGDAFGPSGAGWVRAALVPLLDEFDDALDAWRAGHRL